MHKRNELQKKIQAYLSLHGARVGFIANFVMAVVDGFRSESRLAILSPPL